MSVVDPLYMTDFCPFAQRAWIAFLEKESDPKEPKLFKSVGMRAAYQEVNYFNPSLERTKEFLAIHNTVPAGKTLDGQILKESMPIAYWVDATYPKINPLQPSSDEGKARMKSLISKFTSGTYDVTSPFYQFLMEQDESKWPERTERLLKAYTELGREAQASGGPFLMGSQFTLADVAIIPFVLRALVLLPHYRSFALTDAASLAPFRAWLGACKARPSVQISDADRLPRSIATQPFAATKRADYLREMYAGYAFGVKDIVRKQLANAPPGKVTQDMAAALAQQARETAAADAHKRQNRIIGAVAAVTVGAILVAKLVFWNSSRAGARRA